MIYMLSRGICFILRYVHFRERRRLDDIHVVSRGYGIISSTGYDVVRPSHEAEVPLYTWLRQRNNEMNIFHISKLKREVNSTKNDTTGSVKYSDVRDVLILRECYWCLLEVLKVNFFWPIQEIPTWSALTHTTGTLLIRPGNAPHLLIVTAILYS